MNIEKFKRWGKMGRMVFAVIGWCLGMLVLAGCASKEDKTLFETVRNRSMGLETLQQTEEYIFSQGTENESILIVSYLRKNKKGKMGEEFVVAGTPAEMVDPGKSEFDGKKPLAVRRISHRVLPDVLRRTIPSWFTVYHVTYPATLSRKASLVFTGKNDEKIGRFFYKGPKYLIDKKSIH